MAGCITLILGALLVNAAALSTQQSFSSPASPQGFQNASTNKPLKPPHIGLPHARHAFPKKPVEPYNTRQPRARFAFPKKLVESHSNGKPRRKSFFRKKHANPYDPELPPEWRPVVPNAPARPQPPERRPVVPNRPAEPQTTEPPIVEKSYACTDDEAIVIRPVEQLTNRIKGKVTSNYTIFPMQTPAECKTEEMTLETVSNCYFTWGFLRPLAECWAEEQLVTEDMCGNVCGDFMAFNAKGRFRHECQACLAHLRQNRRKCMYQHMNIEWPCQDCQLKAYAQWDDNCLMICQNVFDDVLLNKDVKQCTECNDVVYKQLKECGV